MAYRRWFAATSVIERSVGRSRRNFGDSIMASVQPLPVFEPRRSIEEFIQLRREMLRYARTFPPGAERNQRRQIALSLRGLFKNKAWLDAHTWEGAALLTDPSPSPVKEVETRDRLS